MTGRPTDVTEALSAVSADEGLAALLRFTAAVTEVTGRGDADTTTLHLSQIGAGGRGATLAESLPLAWADGKLNISIGDEQYRR